MYHYENLDGELLYLTIIPWFCTCAVNYLLGGVFQCIKRRIKKNKSLTSASKYMSISLIWYIILVSLNMVSQMVLDDKITAELKANNVEITQTDWLVFYATILLFDIAVDLLNAVLLCSLKFSCKTLY